MLRLLILLALSHALAAILAAGWRTALITDLLGTAYLLFVVVLHRTWRPVLTRLALLGLIAGVCELATDAAGEHVVHSLSYPSGEPMVWSSPIYMPLSWMLVVCLLAYLGWRLWHLTSQGPGAHRMSLSQVVAVVLTGLAGAIIVPFFEETAYYAGWWRYAPTRLMFGHTPAYVLLFEGLVGAFLPLMAANLRALGWRAVALRGVGLGAWMPLAALIAWLVLGIW
ncbi:MAG TPA: hypothetical protein VF120_14770 [Ktedonobacterales bacterium]